MSKAYDQFNTQVKEGDTIIWAPYKYLYIGKVLHITEGGNIKVRMYNKVLGEFIPNGVSLIRTWRYMVIPMELPK